MNIVFYGGFFSKGIVEIKENVISWWQKKLAWKYLIIPYLAKEEYSIPIEEIAYLVYLNPKFFLDKTRVYMGTKECDSDVCLPLPKSEVPKLMQLLNSKEVDAFREDRIMAPVGIEAKLKRQATVSSVDSLWVYPEVVIGVLGNKTNVQIVRIKTDEPRFFSTVKMWKNFRRRQAIYFGYLNQIRICGLSAKNVDKLKSHFIKGGAPFATTSEKVYNSSWIELNPLKWFFSEKLAFTEDGVIFHQTKWKGSEMMYVPFDAISFVNSKPFCGFLPARVMFLGEQNVISNKRFSASVLRRILREFKSRVGSLCDSGRIVKPGWLYRLTHIKSRKPFIAMAPDKLVFLIRGEKEKLDVGVVSYSGIKEWLFVKKHWYSLVGALYFSGNYDNIRADQQSSFSGYIKGIAVRHYRFMFASGSIKTTFGRNCCEPIKDKNRKKKIKTVIFGDEEKDGEMSLIGSFGKSLFSNS